MKIGIPIICVGNATIGGSGKTPIVIKLRSLLKKIANIFVLTRGYKGFLKGPSLVNNNHSFIDVGDEAILHINLEKPVYQNKIEGQIFVKKMMLS